MVLIPIAGLFKHTGCENLSVRTPCVISMTICFKTSFPFGRKHRPSLGDSVFPRNFINPCRLILQVVIGRTSCLSGNPALHRRMSLPLWRHSLIACRCRWTFDTSISLHSVHKGWHGDFHKGPVWVYQKSWFLSLSKGSNASMKCEKA